MSAPTQQAASRPGYDRETAVRRSGQSVRHIACLVFVAILGGLFWTGAILVAQRLLTTGGQGF